MKHVTITMQFNCTEEFYKSDQIKDMKDSILSGEFQRDMAKDEKAIDNVKITMETK